MRSQLIQAFTEGQRFQEIVQRKHHLCGVLRLAKCVTQRQKRRKRCFTIIFKCGKQRLPHRIYGLGKAIGIHRPRFFPLACADVPKQDVVLHPVDTVACKRRKTGFQIGKHRLLLHAARCGLERRQDKTNDRFGEQITVACKVGRDLRAAQE